jgi:hypothetical protein
MAAPPSVQGLFTCSSMQANMLGEKPKSLGGFRSMIMKAPDWLSLIEDCVRLAGSPFDKLVDL